MKLRPLKEKERQFAADCHYLVEKFLKVHGYGEEFYDIVILDYLQAVQKYLTCEDLQRKYSFETIAFYRMRRAVSNHYRKQNRLKRSVENNCVSLDVMEESVSVPVIEEDFFILEEILSALTEQQQRIVCGKLYGLTAKEICETERMAIATFYREIKRIRKIIDEMLEE